ncbi:EamA family transporter [Streptacidiphilus melanogenes]|uniref:EamA family transporter n=1 Tax=Streptacidiphilus melanogenes TaxID=411235 RepID=UPI000A606C91|nr:EamA family transporter [Streptacidiphilus melanogenes]
MTGRHFGLAVLVAAVWGVNFVAIDAGLSHYPPLLFTALRFLVAAVPAVFLVGRPGVPWRYVLAGGLVLGALQFGLLFEGMKAGMPAGLSSLVQQGQAIFTAVFASALLRERIGARRLLGLGVAVVGMVVAALDQASRGGAAPLGAFALVVGAAAAFGFSNIITRKAAPPDALRWMVWVSVVPPLPLAVLSLLTEGPRADLRALTTFSPSAVGSLLYVAWGATLVGFGLWGYLLRRHDASVVAPFSLLVPVFGMSSAWLLRGEALSPLSGAAAALVISGIAIASVTRPRLGRSVISPAPRADHPERGRVRAGGVHGGGRAGRGGGVPARTPLPPRAADAAASPVRPS